MFGFLNFFSNRAAFHRYEAVILEKVGSNLKAEAAARLRSQMDKINKIQRLFDGEEVDLYQIKDGKAEFDDECRFPDRSDEVLWATVDLIHPQKRAKLKAEVWLVKGRLFALEFSSSPKKYFAGLNIKKYEPELKNLKILFDPMIPSEKKGRTSKKDKGIRLQNP